MRKPSSPGIAAGTALAGALLLPCFGSGTLDPVYAAARTAQATSPAPSPASKQRLAIEKRVKKMIVEQLGVSESDMTPGANLSDDLGADSLDKCELVMQCEQEFSVDITDAEAAKLLTVKDVVDYIQKKLNTPKH